MALTAGVHHLAFGTDSDRYEEDSNLVLLSQIDQPAKVLLEISV